MEHRKYKYNTYYKSSLSHTHTRTHTHTLQKHVKLKQPQYKTHTKLNSHNTFKHPQQSPTTVRDTFVPLDFTIAPFASLHFKTETLHINHITSLHISSTSRHFISHHFTYLHTSLRFTLLVYTHSPLEFTLLVTFFLTLFL